MSELVTQLVKSGDILISPPPDFTASGSKISPIVLLIIVILAVIFFVSGFIHLLVRFLMKKPSFHPQNSTNNVRNSNSEAMQRQLQQLFRLHDSGLDQPLIDALPVFYYKDIMGLKDPFDCAVCLCEFSSRGKLRLLPLFSHAFHISCIDTWLLSHSTCPLCRGSFLSNVLENREFTLDYWRELSFGRNIHNNCEHNKPSIMEENASERRVFSVRLGKFKGVNNGIERGQEPIGSTSSSGSRLDARRCYSLGTYRYVLDDMDFQVALSDEIGASSGINGDVELGHSNLVDDDHEGMKIGRRDRRDSFSVSKIWLWSKKSKFPSSIDTDAC